MTQTQDDIDRKQAEYEYSITAHNYEQNPIGSRDWSLFWKGWKCGSSKPEALTAQPVPQPDDEPEPLDYDSLEWIDGMSTTAGAINCIREGKPHHAFRSVPQAAGVVYGTVWLSMDGNCGCALLGANLQEGESEFVCIDDAPENYTDLDSKSRWAMTQAHKRLCARMGKQLGFYWNYPAQATLPLPSEPVLSEQAAPTGKGLHNKGYLTPPATIEER